MAPSIFRTRTPQGTEILLDPNPQVRSCSVGFWVKRGSSAERPDEQGLAHFIEHTVFKGTARYPTPLALAEATDRLGGNLDAFTGKENACFYGKVLREKLPELLDLLGDLVTAPRFEPEELARERSVILEEIAQSEDQPDDWVSELFYQGFWPGGPLAHPILGRREQVAGYGPEAAQAFFRRTYRAPNLVIAAAGDLAVDDFLARLAPILAALPDGEVGPAPASPAPQPFLRNEPRRDLQQANLVMGFPACAHQDPERTAMGLLCHILGGGMSSRLFMELREKHALCYQIGSYLTPYQDTGALQIAASCAPGKARELVARTAAACAALRHAGPSADELAWAKLQLKTNLVFGQESSSARMFSMAYQAIHLPRLQTLDEQLAEIEAVGPEAVQAVAQRLLDPSRFAVCALGTRRNAAIRATDLQP